MDCFCKRVKEMPVCLHRDRNKLFHEVYREVKTLCATSDTMRKWIWAKIVQAHIIS